ncbi:MAG: vWA domain-containing protein [Bacteroidales bacterium]
MKTEIFNYTDLDFNLDFANFNPEDIEVDETINAVFVVDTSGSVSGYVKELNHAFNDFTKTMQKSHVVDKLFVSVIEFSDTVSVTSGFRPISSIPVMDFSKNMGGSTALYDATYNGLKNALAYRQNLENSGVETKTLLFIITDGEDNSSKIPAIKVKSLIDKVKHEEKNVFSFTTVLFGLGSQANFSKAQVEMGIEHLAQIGTSGAEIRKMIGFISQSISSANAGKPHMSPVF